MFDRIAGFYDVMNSVMTAGLHHRWRERAADLARLGPGGRALDVATRHRRPGSRAGAPRRPGGEVIGSDFSEEMLERARDEGAGGARVGVGQRARAALPRRRFDAATVGFGARNFSDLDRGLAEMARVVRPGGRVVVLEITTPHEAAVVDLLPLWFDRVVPLSGASPARPRPTATCPAR